MHKKRGQSFYAEVLDPSIKKFLNQCSLCGRVGLKPNANQIEYNSVKGEATVDHHTKHKNFSKKFAVDRLQRVYQPLPLDELGRCEVCANSADSDKPTAPD